MRIKASCLVMLIIFAAALFGIMARPLGLLSSLWPANAILAGLMVRNRRMAGLPGWVGAFFGFMAADLLTGSDVTKSLLLTGANLVGAGIGYLYLSRLDPADARLQSTRSVLHLILVSLVASIGAGLAGGGGHVLSVRPVAAQRFLFLDAG